MKFMKLWMDVVQDVGGDAGQGAGPAERPLGSNNQTWTSMSSLSSVHFLLWNTDTTQTHMETEKLKGKTEKTSRSSCEDWRPTDTQKRNRRVQQQKIIV